MIRELNLSLVSTISAKQKPDIEKPIVGWAKPRNYKHSRDRLLKLISLFIMAPALNHDDAFWAYTQLG